MSYPKIWYLRHGETFWNAERRIQGQLESGLTPRGIQDAYAQQRLMQSAFKADPPCFASPLGRAQDTAKIALDGAPYTTDRRLAEAYAGDWQGLLRDDVTSDFPELKDATALELFLAAPNSEGFDAFRARVKHFLDDLEQPSVLVAHGLLGQVVRGLACGLNRAEMGDLPNEQACVYVLEDGVETVLREAVAPGSG